MGTNKALYMDSDCSPLENEKDLSSSLVLLYRARAPLARVALCAYRSDRLALTRLTNSWASRNMKIVFDSVSLFIR